MKDINLRSWTMRKEFLNYYGKVRNLARKLNQFSRNKSGATAIEYALICVGIALAIFVVVNAVGVSLVPVFESVSNGLLS